MIVSIEWIKNNIPLGKYTAEELYNQFCFFTPSPSIAECFYISEYKLSSSIRSSYSVEWKNINETLLSFLVLKDD